jgi:diguanylate cyclase (GGDEF)-like protein
MEPYIIYLESNIFAIAVLIIILLGLRHSQKQAVGERIFIKAVVMNIITLALDILCWYSDGNIILGNLYLNRIISALYYISSGLFIFLWVLYVDFRVYANLENMRRRVYLLILPLLAIFALSIISVFRDCLFYFDSDGGYHRGKYFALNVILSAIYLLYSGVLILKSRTLADRSARGDAAMLTLIAIFSITGIIQSFFYGLNIIWMGSALSLLLIYCTVQNRHTMLDPLTGLNNRGRFDYYLGASLSAPHPENLHLILMDVDDFKLINDKYGHTTGDVVLSKIAEILGSTCSNGLRSDFLARYGGDEFVLICRREDDEAVMQISRTIKDSIKHASETGAFPAPLSLSIGCARFDPKSMFSPQDLIAAADKAMYEDKNTQ